MEKITNVQRCFNTKLYDFMQKSSLNTNGTLEMHKLKLAEAMNVNELSAFLRKGLAQLEEDNKINVIQMGHVARNYIWEICDVKESSVNQNEVIILQQNTIRELMAQKKELIQQNNIHVNKINGLYLEIERLKSINNKHAEW